MTPYAKAALWWFHVQHNDTHTMKPAQQHLTSSDLEGHWQCHFKSVQC